MKGSERWKFVILCLKTTVLWNNQQIHSSDKLSVMDAYRVNRLVKKLNELNAEYTELKKDF